MGDQTAGHRLSLPEMPEDVFVLILNNLNAWDIVRCQKVSRAWREAFLNPEFLRLNLRKYPNARGVKTASHKDGFFDREHVFDPIASRYYHMSQGKARQITKHKLIAMEQYGLWRSIGEWDYHESQPGGRLYYENAATHLVRLGNKPYLFRATLWSYDDGLVACAALNADSFERDADHILSILDLSTDMYHTVPFSQVGKVIRNITFCNRALVIEWAEREPYHDLNDNEKVHRHFATCYDVESALGPDGEPSWQITHRNEWKMHFLGLPLNSRDRFFSTHNGTHYAVYLWQPNRSMYTGDEDMPIEALFVWDVATRSSYLPSADPTGSALPNEEKRPHMLARYSFRDLDFIGIRQHANISLLTMSLDSDCHSLTVKENVCVAGQGYFDPAERLMQVTTTTFPFLGQGPVLRREWEGDLPPYRGHCSMESDEVESLERWFLPVMDVVDPVADVRLSLVETCFTGQSVENKLVLRIKSLGEWTLLDDKIAREVAGMGRIAGDERWIVGQNGLMELVVVKF